MTKKVQTFEFLGREGGGSAVSVGTYLGTCCKSCNIAGLGLRCYPPLNSPTEQSRWMAPEISNLFPWAGVLLSVTQLREPKYLACKKTNQQ